MTDPLFVPLRMGDLTLPNRIVMPPLTRHRADPATLAATALNATYYAQRASAGLLIAEASQISQEGQGYINTPGIYTATQVAGWKLVTDAVKQAGGRIFCQLWHVGRLSHVSLQPDGGAPVAPSAIPAETKIFLESGFTMPSMPRALELTEIPRVISDFRRAAENAKRAGFDGVEVHGANGYLIDQFMRDGSNQRTDAYGGSVSNRLRFALDVVDAAVSVFGPGRVGMRMAPTSREGSMHDSNPRRYSASFFKSSTDASWHTPTLSWERGRVRAKPDSNSSMLRQSVCSAERLSLIMDIRTPRRARSCTRVKPTSCPSGGPSSLTPIWWSGSVAGPP